MENQIRIPFLVYWSGTKCTLKCRDCCNLIPYMPQVSFDYLENMRDLFFLSSKVKVDRLQLQGGEIFTHPDVDKIISFAGELPIPIITLTTNGTVLLSDSTLEVLQKNSRIAITISHYECTTKQRDKLVEQLKEAKITYHIYEFNQGDSTWFRTGGPLQHEVSQTKLNHNFVNCLEKSCITMADGFLYFCGKARAIKMFHDVPDCNYDTVNVRAWRNGEDQSESFIRFMAAQNIPKPECAFCLIKRGEKIKPAEQMSRAELKEILAQLPQELYHA